MSLRAKSIVRILVGFLSLIVLLALIGYSATGAPPDPGPSDLSLTASPRHETNGTWRLPFELSYSGENSLVVSERSLPWKSPRNLLLVAVPLNASRRPLVGSDSLDPDLPSASLTLNPGDSLSGSVNVSARFPDLAAAIRETDVMIFWSHQLRASEAPAFPRLAGGVLLPRQR